MRRSVGERRARRVAVAIAVALLAGAPPHPASAQRTSAAPPGGGRFGPLPDDTFRLAIRRDPDNARLHLELGRWYRHQSFLWLRSQGPSHFRTAVRLARAQGDGGLEAEAEVELAKVAWVSYERYGRTFQFTGNVSAFDVRASFAEWRYVEEFFEHHAQPLQPDRGAREYRAAEEHARAALAAEPGHLAATLLLAVILGDHGRWEEILTLARGAVRAQPAAPDGYRVLGLALRQTGRIGEAARAFANALARMTADQRRPYENLGAILRRADQAHYDSLPPTSRRSCDSSTGRSLSRWRWTPSIPHRSSTTPARPTWTSGGPCPRSSWWAGRATAA